MLRKYQISLGDIGSAKASGTVYEGYTFRKPVEDGNIWESLFDFPTDEPATDREMIRIFAGAERISSPIGRWLVVRIAESPDHSERIHALIALSRMKHPLVRKNQELLASSLLALDEKMAQAELTTDTNWPLRMGEVMKELFLHQKGLATIIADSKDYGRPGHLWIAQASGIPRRSSAEAFLQRSREGKSYAWSVGQVEFLTELPTEEARALLEKLFRAGGVDEAVVVALSRIASPADAPIFKRYLGSPSSKTVLASVRGLEGAQAGPKDWAKAIGALRRFADPKTDATVRSALVTWLQGQTKQTHGDTVADWERWLAKEHPDAAEELTASTGYDPVKWKPKVDAVKWDEGNAANGQKLFAKANCAACHNGGRASGPSLEGVAKRFNREDLLATILDPNRDVSPRYRTIRVTTVQDKTYEGIVIYEASDGVILQTGADATVRIAGKEIQSTKPGTLSLMPAGLLDEFKPNEIADLFAYLKTLDTPKR